MKVCDADGEVWLVHRRWLPWNPKKRKIDGDSGLDFLDVFGGVDDLIGGLIALAIGLLLALLAPLVLIVLVTGLEVILLLAVLPFAIVGRMFFGKRWWVQVRRGLTLEREEMVGDWQQSGARVREIAKAISTQHLTSSEAES